MIFPSKKQRAEMQPGEESTRTDHPPELQKIGEEKIS
jgi:hypothetical protein